MTLRHRLLLVYLIVVLLSVATVAVAVVEMGRSRQIIRELQDWNEIALHVRKLVADFPPISTPVAQEEFAAMLARQYLILAEAEVPDYLDVERVRRAVNEVDFQYRRWMDAAASHPEQTQVVGDRLRDLSAVLEGELDKLNYQASQQDYRTRVLLAVVMVLTVLHVAVVGSLLRRWLLRPMEQLNRQVAALARDEPASEPLLSSPREMATLAQALDRARQSLGQLRQQLIDAERLTTIGQFAAQLAHNLRNPLASIRAAAQMTCRQHLDDADIKRRMNDIMGSIDRLNRWISGLMEVARRESTPARQADVIPLLHRVSEAVQPELQVKELHLDVIVPPEGLICMYDPATLEHALIAMVVNAIEASPMGKRITIRGESVPAGDRAAVCRLSVCDQGPGLPTDNPDRIFEFSYSTKQRGMGLGLALAQLALQRQGGSVRAFNNPDGGATIRVELPIE